MIYCVPVRGVFETNCYFYVDEDRHAFLIDPGAQGEELLGLIREQGWMPEAILLTHGHFDHIGGIAAIREQLDIPVLIHENGERILENPEINLSAQCGVPMTVRPDRYLRDGDTLKLNGKDVLRVIHTPGHTADSVILYSGSDQAAFVGDTIFKGSCGNYRYPTGDYRTLMNSIRERIMTLPDGTTLLSGHSEPTTVGAEKKFYRSHY